MGSARPSVTKRQREQLKRERKLRKAEKRAERKTTDPDAIDVEQMEPLDGPADEAALEP